MSISKKVSTTTSCVTEEDEENRAEIGSDDRQESCSEDTEVMHVTKYTWKDWITFQGLPEAQGFAAVSSIAHIFFVSPRVNAAHLVGFSLH